MFRLVIIKKITIFLLLQVCMFLFVVCVYADPNNEPYQEVGDDVYRDLDFPFSFIDRHPGIYLGYQSGQPNDDTNHNIIEHGPQGVQPNTLHDFVHVFGEYYGAHYLPGMTREKRDAIVGKAVTIGSFPYPSPPIEARRIFIQWFDTNGDGNLDYPSEEITALRSDGFVQLVFALEGIHISNHNLFTETQWFTRLEPGGLYTLYLPSVQQSYMLPSPAQDPTKVTNLRTAEHSNAIGKWHNPQSRNPNVAVTWDSATDTHSGLKHYFSKWDLEPHTIPSFNDPIINADTTTVTKAGLQDGKHYFHIRSIDNAGNWSEEGGGYYSTAHLGPIYIDTLPPHAVTNLHSGLPIQQWYNLQGSRRIPIRWTQAEDDTTYTEDVSGLDGYSTLWSTDPQGLPDEEKDIDGAFTYTESPSLPDGQNHYFHIRSVDNAGNWDDEAAHLGPFWVDTKDPIATLTVLRTDFAYTDQGESYITGKLFKMGAVEPAAETGVYSGLYGVG